MIPTVSRPIFRRCGANLRGRLKDFQFTEPVSMRGHAGESDCLLHLVGRDPSEILRPAKDRRLIPEKMGSRGLFQREDELPNAIGNTPNSAIAAANTFVCDTVRTHQGQTALASQEMELVENAPPRSVG